MLRADFMPRTDDAPVQERECGLNCISVNVAVNIDPILVLDRLVLTEYASVVQGLRVSLKLIRHNHINIAGDVLFDVLCQSAALYILSVEEAKLPTWAALTDTDDYLFLAL